jgi:hypothetical protein
MTHFGDTLQRAVEGTPFSVELLCGIACQETAFLWLPLVQKSLGAREVLARSIGDASGDAPNTGRKAFPVNTAAFRAEFGDEFTGMLIAEANASRALRGMGPKQWVYKGYGIFQYDLQHVRIDDAFFRSRQWYEFEACVGKVLDELTVRLRRTGELWAAVKAYNGTGPRADEYRDNVRVFAEIARNEIGRMMAGPAPAAPQIKVVRPHGTRPKKGKTGAKRAVQKPMLTQAQLRKQLVPFTIDRTVHPIIVVGIRGYYRDTMGAPGVNDRGIYDDAIFIDTPDTFAAFNGNTDPSRVRIGQGTGAERGMAVLNPGIWYVHRFDLHKEEYLALCQRTGQVTVTRDGTPPYADTGMFGINIHRGGYNTTSSLGCQTVHPDQWSSFITLAVDHAKRWHGARWNSVVIPYALLEEE